MTPDKEEFTEWLGHPVTEWVLGLVGRFSDKQRDLWAKAAWDSGDADPLMLLEARTRADSYRSLSDSSYEDWMAIDDSER